MEQGIVSVDQAIQVILVVASGIAIIGGAGVIIGKCVTPFIETSRRLDQAGEDHELLVVVAKGVMYLLEHGETGNATGKMAETRCELENHIYK